MKIHRFTGNPAGADVELNGKIYEFRPNEQGDVVCEVGKTSHSERLLSIPGYCEYGKNQSE